jgi:hypothetical protein
MFNMLILLRLAWWLAGLALPEKPVLAHRLREALWAILYAVAAGVLISGVMLACIGGVYLLLLEQGTRPLTAFFGLAFLTSLLAGGLLFRANLLITLSANLKEDVSLFSKDAKGRPEGHGFSSLASAFLEGLMQPPPPQETIRPRRMRRSRVVNTQQVHLTDMPIEGNLNGLITQPIIHSAPPTTH